MKIDGVSWVMEVYLKDGWYPWDASFVMDEADGLREEFEKPIWGNTPRRIKAYVRHDYRPAEEDHWT